MSISTFVNRSLRDPGYAWRRLVWGVHQHIPERVITMPTRHGRLSFSSRDYVIGRLLCLNGEYGMTAIRRAAEILSREPRRGHIMLDVGANVGTVCLAPSLRTLYSRAIAIEPEPANFRLLATNIKRNNANGTVAIQCAVGEREAAASVRLSRDNHGDHRIEESSAGNINVRRIDDILANLHIAPDDVGLIWMDIQGHEAKALAGASSLLSRKTPLVTEFYPYALREAGSDPDDLLRLLRDTYSRFCAVSSHSADVASDVASTNRLTLDALGLTDAGPMPFVDLLLLP